MKDQNEDVTQRLLAIEQQLFEAIKRKDLKSLDGLLAADFVHRSPDGSEVDKGGFLQNVGAMPVEVTAIRGEHQHVKVLGNVAVLTGVQLADWRQDDKGGVSRGAFTDVFEFRGDAWLLMLAYTVELRD